jgi:glycosyltransferase involved in cell wall biosynthesis
VSDPTRVIVDGRALGDDSAYRGIGRYLGSLLDALAQRDDVTVTALSKAAVRLPEGIGRKQVLRLAPGRFASREHDLLLPADLARTTGDVVHSPAQDPPRRCSRPWVQTLHGLVPLVDPSPDFAGERKQWARWGPRFKRADAVIAVSAFCADQGVRLLGLEPSRVHVVHHGVGEQFRTVQRAESDDPPYLLFVGEFGPSKGHTEAYQLIAALADRGLPHRLKVAGRIAPWYREAVESQVRDSPRADRVDLLGYVDDDLPGLYANASALVITSRYESFCLPAIEAMATGLPVVAYANTALPETIGDAGRLVPDGDLNAFVEMAHTVLSESRLAEELQERGRERAADFSWKVCAERHAQIFIDAAD